MVHASIRRCGSGLSSAEVLLIPAPWAIGTAPAATCIRTYQSERRTHLRQGPGKSVAVANSFPKHRILSPLYSHQDEAYRKPAQGPVRLERTSHCPSPNRPPQARRVGQAHQDPGAIRHDPPQLRRPQVRCAQWQGLQRGDDNRRHGRTQAWRILGDEKAIHLGKNKISWAIRSLAFCGVIWDC